MAKQISKTALLWVAGAIALISSGITLTVQHYISNVEKKTQLYFEEKKDFVLACDEYLRQYREWHELMNTMSHKDNLSMEEAKTFKANYDKWTKDFDYAYGKIFLLSNNEFGPRTLFVSNRLHLSLDSIWMGKNSPDEMQRIAQRADSFFFSQWLQPAQLEIFKYNSGNREEVSLQQFIDNQRKGNE